MSFLQGFNTSQSYFNNKNDQEFRLRQEQVAAQEREDIQRQQMFKQQESKIENVLGTSAQFAKDFSYLKDTNPKVYEQMSQREIQNLTTMRESLLGTPFEQYVPRVDATIAAFEYGLSPRQQAQQSGVLEAEAIGAKEKTLQQVAPKTFEKEFPAPKQELPSAAMLKMAVQDRAAGGVPSSSVYGEAAASYARSITPEQAQKMVVEITGTPEDVFTERTVKEAEALRENLITTQQAQKGIDRALEILQDPNTATGTAADIVLGLGNIAGTIKQLAEASTGVGVKTEAVLNPDNYDFSKFDKTVAETAAMKSVLIDLAYTKAAAAGQTGRALSDKDIKAQLDILAANISNKAAMQRTLSEVKAGLSRNFNTRKNIIAPDAFDDLPEVFQTQSDPFEGWTIKEVK